MSGLRNDLENSPTCSRTIQEEISESVPNSEIFFTSVSQWRRPRPHHPHLCPVPYKLSFLMESRVTGGNDVWRLLSLVSYTLCKIQILFVFLLVEKTNGCNCVEFRIYTKG